MNVAPVPAPDLLFEDVLERRLADLRPYLLHPECLPVGASLHRATFFLTLRCNLRCSYCKMADRFGGSEAGEATLGSAGFLSWLDRLDGAPIRHLHLTGGEASLAPELPQIVRLARAYGIPALSLTTNGTAAPALYLRLVENGLTEIRVSLDAATPGLGARLTASRDAWERAVATIQTLARARAAGAAFHLIVNTVVTAANRARLAEIVEWFIALGTDDLKLITEVDRRDDLGVFPEREENFERIRTLLDGRYSTAYPLLRRKIETVFSREAIGLKTLEKTRRWRCFVPLTERTVAAGGYYPCSVYFREGGNPIGSLSDSAEVQRERTISFVRDADCLADPICRKYCLHCTRQFNIRANAEAATEGRI